MSIIKIDYHNYNIPMKRHSHDGCHEDIEVMSLFEYKNRKWAIYIPIIGYAFVLEFLSGCTVMTHNFQPTDSVNEVIDALVEKAISRIDLNEKFDYSKIEIIN